jgi:hypothetical protein
MSRTLSRTLSRSTFWLVLTCLAIALVTAPLQSQQRRGVVRCANLVYANNKTSVCFSSEFLVELSKKANVATEGKMATVNLESAELYDYPFAIMTGEGSFLLSETQRSNLRNYLSAGGFVVASAGCSSKKWATSFRSEIRKVFPDVKLVKLEPSHPVFHTVYDIEKLQCKRNHEAKLEGLEIDGKIVLIFSEDGLNDTGNVGGNCCCCGGNEILNARQVNVNLLSYTLTH